MIARKLGVGVLLGLTLAGTAGRSQPRSQPQTVYVTCMLPDMVRSVLYVSDTFRGFSDKQVDYANSFRSMLRDKYPGVYGEVTCPMWPNELQAEHETAAQMHRISGMYRQVTPTGWMP